MDRRGYQDLPLKFVQNGVPEGGNATSSFQLEGKAEPVGGTGRFLEIPMSGSRQDTSGAAEGPLAEPNSGQGVGLGMDKTVVEKRGSSSFHTPRSVGSSIMRGRALRTEDSKIEGFHRSLLKSRGMHTKSRADVQSQMMSFRSLLEGAISASGSQPTTSAQRIAESSSQYDGLVTNRTPSESYGEGRDLPVEGVPELRKGERHFTLRAHDSCALRGDTVSDSVSHVSYSSLLQAQLGDHPVEARSDFSCKTVGTLRLGVEAPSPPDKFQLQSPDVEGGFLALLNQTTRSHAPVAQQPSSPRADSVSNEGRTSGVRLSDKLLRAVDGDTSRSAGAVSELDGCDLLRATAVPTSTVLARSEGDAPLAETVEERRSSKASHWIRSDDDALVTPLLEKVCDAFPLNESRSSDLVSERPLDFSNTVPVPLPGHTRRGQDVSRADVLVGDSASSVDEMSDAQILEELSRGLAIEESSFVAIASEKGVVDSPEAAAAFASAVPTGAQQSVRQEVVEEQSTVVMGDSLSTDEKALDIQLSEDCSGALGVDESRLAHNVQKGDVIDSPEAAGVPGIPDIPRVEEAGLPTGIERASCVVADAVFDEENVSDVRLSEEVPQALALDESRSAEIVPERDVVDSLGSATVPPPPALVRSEVDVPRVEVVVPGSKETGEEMSDLLVSDQPSQPLALDVSRNRGIVMEENPAKLPEDSAEPESILHTNSREDVPLTEAFVEKELGLCGDVAGFPETRKDHLVSLNHSDEGLSDGRIQSPQRLVTEKRCTDGCDGLTDIGTALVSSCQASLKQIGNADADAADVETILESSHKNGLKQMEAVDKDVLEQRADYLREVVAAGRVAESTRQAVLKQTENPNALFVEEQCHALCDDRLTSSTEIASFNSKADIDSTNIALEMELDVSEGGPVHSLHTETVKDGPIVNALVEKPSSLSPRSSNEGINQLEVGQHNLDPSADELTGKQLSILPSSESQGVNQGYIVSGASCESEELPSSELVVRERDVRNDVERVEGHSRETYDIATDSGNTGIPVDPNVSPGAVSEELRQVIIRDSDATVSESLESVQVSGAEFGARQEAGKEVQSPLVPKSKESRSRDVGALENRLISHSDDLEEIEEQPYASPLNGTVNDQLVGVEVLSFKKKGRPRVDNHEKALHGAGRPHLQPSGSKRKRHLQYAGNRWRRNRHIDPGQPVPVYIEGRDEGFEEADDGSFSRWLAHQDKGNCAPSPSIRKRVRKHGPELIKPIIAIPSFRVVADYEERQQEVETRRKAEMQRHAAPCTHEMPTVMSSRTVRASDYDMDDEDERWLHAWNKRIAQGALMQPISEDKFEEMIEYFERKYAQMEVDPNGNFPGYLDYQKSLAHSVPGSSIPSSSPSDTATGKPSDGSLQKSFKPSAEQRASDDCCICNGGEDDQNNPVYTCKRCLIHVHQSCYGIREKFRDDEGRVIAPPSWCCRKCEAVAVGAAQPNVSCVLCRRRGGALKPTVAPRKWAHVACALYTNETFFVDPDAMEPIDGISAVAARAQDRQDRCGLCGVKRGLCSLCSVRGCRAPFHISCGVSQGASFELRQSKKKVLGVRSFCPRHARTTPMDASPSAGLKEGHLVSNSTTSGSTASATASGSISTASSLDDREEWSSRQDTACMDRSFIEPTRQASNVGSDVPDVMDNVVSGTGKGTQDKGREKSNGLRFTLKRRWDDSCNQVSEDGVASDAQKKFGNGKAITGDKIEVPGCKPTWHVVESGQKLKRIKFKFGKHAKSQDPDSSPNLVQQEGIGSEDPEAEKMKEAVPVVGDTSVDAYVTDRDTMFVNGLTEERFVKEVKELAVLEQALKSDVAPVHIMREAFVYWRAKRAGHKGFLLCELNHKQWSKFQGIFNKDSTVEGNRATGKLRVPLALQPSPMSTEKMLEKAKELRAQLDRVRSMAQKVVRREKLKCHKQLVQMTIASAELHGVESTSEEPHCVWCPSTKTLLKCGTCPRSFCFNCFKSRKGFGVKGWMAASKQAMYSCKYCRELMSSVADLSNDLEVPPEEIVDAGLVSSPMGAGERVGGMASAPMTSCDPLRGVRGTEMRNMRDEGWGLQGLDNPSPGGCETIASAKGLGVGRGKGFRWTASENAGPALVRRGPENGASNLSKLGELESGLNKFLSIANDQMEHSSFETTLRRLKILRNSNKDVSQEQVTSAEIPSGDVAEAEETVDRRASGPALNESEPSTRNVSNVSVLVSPASGPALLVYKKNRRLILNASADSPPSAYDFSDKQNYSPTPTGLENVTSEMPLSPTSGVIAKRLEIGGLERI